MNILITGSSGLIGSNLSRSLAIKKHRILHLVRTKPTSENDIYWNPVSSDLDAESLEGVDAVVHLAGENIFGMRWTEEKKRKIRDSRIQGTRLLSEAVAGLKTPPSAFISASAIGFYGDRGEERLTENSAPGRGFLSDVCREWEKNTGAAEARGIRVVHLRNGIVLSTRGGALKKMLPVFRIGLGGKIGNGRQYMSWISLQDLVGIIAFSIENESLRGPVNAVSPNPVSNRVFSKTLGKVLSRPSWFTLPGFGARAAFGEMADALLLSSTRVVPARLIDAGFRFRFESLEFALNHALSAE
ncbi:MAG: TIGR01777 family oxidoreductase [Acidobacteriota bacterium]